MRSVRCAFCICLLAALLAAPLATAVEPSYRDQFGNPEEPALRPITWLWHGSKAVFQRATHGVRQSKDDPRLGNFVIESGKGTLQSVVEVGESVIRGAIHSTPPPKGAHKALGTWNVWLRDDFPYVVGARKEVEGQKAAEAGVTYMPAPPGSPVAATGSQAEAAAPRPEQPVVGSSEREPEAPKSIQPVYTLAGEEAKPQARPESRPESSVEQARRRYLGDRAGVNRAQPGRGNLLRLAR